MYHEPVLANFANLTSSSRLRMEILLQMDILTSLFLWQETNPGSIPTRNTSLIYTSFDQLEGFLVGFHPTERALNELNKKSERRNCLFSLLNYTKEEPLIHILEHHLYPYSG